MKASKPFFDRLERTNLLIEDALLNSKPQRIRLNHKHFEEITESAKSLIKSQLENFPLAKKSTRKKDLTAPSVASRLTLLRRLLRSRPEFAVGLSSVFGGNLTPNSPEAEKLVGELIKLSKGRASNVRNKS